MTDLQKKIAGLGIAGLFVPFLLVLLFPLVLYFSWVEKLLWNWFAAGYLHLQPITLWPVVGITMLIGLIVTDRRAYEGHKLKSGETILAQLAAYTFALVMGYIVHRCTAQ